MSGERLRTRPESESGYVLFGIVIMVVILGISMAAAVPLWDKVVQREREQELIWRGYQYKDAIERYQAKFPGAFPPNLEVLVEQKFLRKLYPDPMSEDGEWRVLRQNSPELQLAAQRQAGIPGASAGTGGQPGQPGATGGFRQGQAQIQRQGQGQGQGQRPPRQGQPRGGQFQSSIGRGLGDAALGGIVGVASASDLETFYRVPGRDTYADWLFVIGIEQQGVVPQAGVPVTGNLGGVLPPPPGRFAFRTGALGAPGVPAVPGANPGPGQNPALPPGLGQGQPPGLPQGMGGQGPGQQQNPFGAPGMGTQQQQQQQQQQPQQRRRQR